ncbi:hypothetical protein L3Q82_024691 [Scortum barcoo]|uniref:Uncharacterized protein n=1 Tax=Scortum barcoo TaxID=214431 RepID=A0ACB8WRF3_9TELE|nr:hypothetical protein L3Q82_024691 [Scortum barcoo]
MLACTEMITMCLQSAKQKHLRAQLQQQPPHTAGQGLTIFHDIFRRADKNDVYILCVSDDGKLSFDEFNAYFADGILTTEELQELFYSIDGRQNNNLDTDKLSDYFSQHLGEYLNVLSALESLNVAILKAMDKTKEEYQGSSVLGQFVTRFMLRETSSQLLSLQRSLQCAMEAVEEQSSPAPLVLQYDTVCVTVCAYLKTLLSFSLMLVSPGLHRCHGRREVKAPEQAAVQRNGRRCGRRVHNNLCMSPSDPCSGILTTGVSMEDGENWCSQINRLQQLLDKLECQGPKLEPLKEDTLASTYKSNILLVQRQMSVNDENLDNFRKVLKSYIDATAAHSDNLHYLQSNSSKDFQRCTIDMLEDAEVVSTMLLPGLYVCAFTCVCIELLNIKSQD